LGVSISTLGRWERGEMRPHRRKAVAIAKEFGVTVKELGFDEPEEGLEKKA
jgi:transcriptional regulator with XRE-family HTH domain